MPEGGPHRDELAVLFYSDFREQDWWTFEVFLEGPEKALDFVEEVTYVLPPSFTPPIRHVQDRASQFRLEGSTSSPFSFHVGVRYRDGSDSSSTHTLTLSRNLRISDLAALPEDLVPAGSQKISFHKTILLSRIGRPPLSLTNGSAWMLDSQEMAAFPLPAEGESWVALRFECEELPGFASGSPGVVTNYWLSLHGTVVQALQDRVEEFVVPESFADFAALPQGAVVTIEGQGSLDFQAQVDVGFEPNVLHSLSDGPGRGQIMLGGERAVLAVRWRISSACTVQINRSLAGVSLRFVLKGGSGTAVSASILDSTRLLALFHSFLGIEADPEQSRLALEFALARRLELALTAQASALVESTPAFAIEFDPEFLNAAERVAVGKALCGDLLTVGQPGAPLSNVRVTRNILGTISQLPHNIVATVLAGAYDAACPQVGFTPGTGELLVAGAGEPPITFRSIYYGIPEGALVKRVDEHFLTSAAFRTAFPLQTEGLPELRQRYFASLRKASAADVVQYLRVGQALEIVSPNETAASGDIEDPGHIDVRIELAFDQLLTRSLFFVHGSAARGIGEYEQIGRRAMSVLIRPDGVDSWRLHPLQDDALWNQLKEIGPANFRALFSPIQAAMIASDYLSIRWWAESMSSAAQIIVRLETCTEPEVQKKFREQFSRALDQIRKSTREDFGAPWGLVATYLAAGRRPRATMEIVGPRFTLRRLQGAAVTDSITA